jgi:hypothetical protein
MIIPVIMIRPVAGPVIRSVVRRVTGSVNHHRRYIGNNRRVCYNWGSNISATGIIIISPNAKPPIHPRLSCSGKSQNSKAKNNSDENFFHFMVSFLHLLINKTFPAGENSCDVMNIITNHLI